MRKPGSNIPAVTVLVIVLAATAILSVMYGAVNISQQEMYTSLQKWTTGNGNMSLDERIFITLRLPRAVLCILVGASLAVGGVLMQALFRNPVVEPGLAGTSSGAAFGAALYFVLGGMFRLNAGTWTLPLAACGGALLSTLLVFGLSVSAGTGKRSVTALLLTGIAVNALFMSGVGFLSYIARDPQARSVTFWGLGTLSGASWQAVIITGITTIGGTYIAMRHAKSLNLLMLGEEEAQLLGVRTGRLKVQVLLVNIIMIAAATAFTGVISFTGLVVPHLMRMIGGPDNKPLIINSALAGAILLSLADLVSRMALRPAELPIGIVTTIVGVPVFITLLRSKNYLF
ncbi:FecCD family ABC transporter permease [Chitinophagaceae bacterium MMS25-I14]